MMTIPSIDVNFGTDGFDAAGAMPIEADAQSAAGPNIPVASVTVSAFQRAMEEPIAANAALGEAFAAAVAATVSEEAIDLPPSRRAVESGGAVFAAPAAVTGERDARPCQTATDDSIGAPVVATAEVDRPSVASANAEQPSAIPIRVEQPSALPVGVEQTSVLPAEVDRPIDEPAKVEQPGVASTRVEQSSALSAEIERPMVDSAKGEQSGVLPAKAEQLVVVQPKAEEAGVSLTGVDRPMIASVDVKRPIAANPVRNRGETESAEALVAAGVAPKIAPQPGIAIAPESPAAPSITPAEVVRAQAAVSAVASAAPVAPTPAAVLVEAAQAVADTLLVSPGLLRGQGEIVVQLRPDVLEGTEVRIAVTGRQLDVQFRPTTVDMSVLLENGRTQIASHLSAKIATFNVTVDVRKKRV